MELSYKGIAVVASMSFQATSLLFLSQPCLLSMQGHHLPPHLIKCHLSFSWWEVWRPSPDTDTTFWQTALDGLRSCSHICSTTAFTISLLLLGDGRVRLDTSVGIPVGILSQLTLKLVCHGLYGRSMRDISGLLWAVRDRMLGLQQEFCKRGDQSTASLSDSLELWSGGKNKHTQKQN